MSISISEQDDRTIADKLGLAAAYSALFLLGLFGNTIIIVIYFKWKSTFKMYKVTYIFLLSLTWANLAVSVGVMPLSIASLIAGHWVFGEIMCTMNGFIFTWMATISILTMLLISFHRATVVLSPLRRLIKTGTARNSATFMWIFGLIVPFPPLLGLSTYEYSSTRAFCRVRFVSYDDDKAGNIYSLVTVSLFVILPLVVVCIANVALYRVSVRLLKASDHQHTALHSQRSRPRGVARALRGELKALTTVTLVMGIFVLCWAPQVVLTIYGIIRQTPTPNGLQTLQALCVFLNSAVNPYIYIYANKEIRKRFTELVHCKVQGSPKFVNLNSQHSVSSLNPARFPLVKHDSSSTKTERSGSSGSGKRGSNEGAETRNGCGGAGKRGSCKEGDLNGIAEGFSHGKTRHITL